MNDDVQRDDNKLLEYKITELEKKLDLVLEQLDLILRTNARLTNLPEIIEKSISTSLNKRAMQGYSRISA